MRSGSVDFRTCCVGDDPSQRRCLDAGCPDLRGSVEPLKSRVVRVGIDTTFSIDTRDHRPEADFHTHAFERASRPTLQRHRKRGKNRRPGIEQHHARGGRVEAAEVVV